MIDGEQITSTIFVLQTWLYHHHLATRHDSFVLRAVYYVSKPKLATNLLSWAFEMNGVLEKTSIFTPKVCYKTTKQPVLLQLELAS